MKLTKYLYLIIFLFLITLTACQKEEDKIIESNIDTNIKIDTNNKEQKTEPLPSKNQNEPEHDKNGRIIKDNKVESFLSGKFVDKEIGYKRPLAIMISNDKEALPNYGLSKADIVYEAPAEGQMNRYLALIEDYSGLDRIGSVRSARTYYTYFAREWNAILFHFGQSSFALEYLKNMDHVNGVDSGNAYFYRTKDRKKPHNAYTSSALINEAIKKFKYKVDYDTEYKGNIKFVDDQNLENGLEAKTVKVGYALNKAYFEYSENDKLYYRYQYGKKHISDNKQIAVDNIILSYNRMTHYATTEYRDIALHEEMDGYFITRGKFIPIKILKRSPYGTTYYYDMDGNEIKFNRGKTWICIIDKKDYSKTEILDSHERRTNN